MSENTTPTVDRTEIRKAIRDTVRDHPDLLPRAEVVTLVQEDTGVPETTIHDEIDALEKHGFVYLVGETQVVKLP